MAKPGQNKVEKHVEPKVEQHVEPKVEPKKAEHRIFRAKLPNGSFIEKRSRFNAYARVIVQEMNDGTFVAYRWTTRDKGLSRAAEAAAKLEGTKTSHVLEVQEVEEALAPIDRVYESKKAAGSAAKLRGLKMTDIEEVEGGFRVKPPAA